MNSIFMRQGMFFVILLLIIISGSLTDVDQLIQTIVFGLPAVVIALTLHEFAHAFAADRFGDPTPRAQGRLSLDIRKHVDPVGLILFIFAGFGWAKPVETDPRNLKNPKTDMAFIAIAGPVMNILLFMITIIVASKLGMSGLAEMQQAGSAFNSKFALLLFYIAWYNICFAIFNLIPIPPLDGSKIIKGFLSTKNYVKYTEFEYKNQGFLTIGLLAVIFFIPDAIRYFVIFFLEPIEAFSLFIASFFPF